MISKTNGSGKKTDESSSKTIPQQPLPKKMLVSGYYRPTIDSILNEYPEISQFFELKTIGSNNETDNNKSKNKNASSKQRSSTQNGKFSLNKIFKFTSNKSEQKGIFGFGKNKSASLNKPENPPPSAVRESLQRAALSLTNSYEITDTIEKRLKKYYQTINNKIKKIPQIDLNLNIKKPNDKRNRKKNQSANSNTNALTYSYMIKILFYLLYQEKLKICKAHQIHIEKHKKYIQNLLEIVNIINKDHPNTDLIINGKLLNYSIMDADKIFQAVISTTTLQALTSTSGSYPKFNNADIGDIMKYFKQKLIKHQRRVGILSFKIEQLQLKDNSSRLIIINELLNKLFNIDYSSSTINIKSSCLYNDLNNNMNPAKRKIKQYRARKTSYSTTKSHSSSNLNQMSRRQSDLIGKNEKTSFSPQLNEKKERRSFDDIDEQTSFDQNQISDNDTFKNPSTQNLPKYSQYDQTHNQNTISNDGTDNYPFNDNDNNDNKNLNDNHNKYDNIDYKISVPSLEELNELAFNSESSSQGITNFPEYEVMRKLSPSDKIDKVPPLIISNSDSAVIKDQSIEKENFFVNPNLSDSESIQIKNKKNENDYEYSEYSTDDDFDLDDDEGLAEFQNVDENDTLLEETLGYIEDKNGLLLDFELLIEKAFECTEFQKDLIIGTIRKIKKSPKDSGIHILKLCQIFIEVFLELEKKREEQRLQQVKMEQNALIASQMNKSIPQTNTGLVPYPTNSIPQLNENNTISNDDDKEKTKDVTRFLFVMFSKYIFNDIYITAFHQEFFYVQDYLFSNSILNALVLVPSSTDELKHSLPYIPTDLQNLKLQDFTMQESFRDYSKCVEDIVMLQFQPSLVDFCYSAFKILDRIQKIASEILYDKKIEEELVKERDEIASSYHQPKCINNINNPLFSADNSTANTPSQINHTNGDEKSNSNSLPKVTLPAIKIPGGDEDSSNNNKLISSSTSNSSVTLPKEFPSLYSSRKSKMQLLADCQLSCDQLLDITTVLVIIAGPFDLKKMIDLFAPFAGGLRLSSQLEFAFMTLQSVCSHIIEDFSPDNGIQKLSSRSSRSIDNLKDHQNNKESRGDIDDQSN